MSITAIASQAGNSLLASVVDQLDAVKAFIAEHQPPVTRHYPMTLGYCAASPAEVDEICAGLGMTPRWVNECTYAAEKPFGTEARYRVAYVAKVFSQPVPAEVPAEMAEAAAA